VIDGVTVLVGVFVGVYDGVVVFVVVVVGVGVTNFVAVLLNVGVIEGVFVTVEVTVGVIVGVGVGVFLGGGSASQPTDIISSIVDTGILSISNNTTEILIKNKLDPDKETILDISKNESVLLYTTVLFFSKTALPGPIDSYFMRYF
jgi:hypothetical protein